MPVAYWLLAAQGLLGGIDNIWNHEWRAKLPSSPSARRELQLHAARGLIYGPVFLAFAWAELRGLFAVALLTILAIELVITLADFVEEDRSRALSPQERILHGLLTLNYGAFLALILPDLLTHATTESAIIPADHGWMSWLLTLYAVGSSGFGLREAIAAHGLRPVVQRPAIQVRPNLQPQSILVTGGTGFIGTALVRRLIARGDKVYVIARSPAKAVRLFGNQALIAPSLQALPETVKIDAVVNLAGAPVFGRPWTDARKVALVRSRVDTTRALVDWIADHAVKPRVLVSASAIGWYGADRGDQPLTENARSGSDFPAMLCGAWEKGAERAKGIVPRVCRLRIGLVLGRDGGMLRPMMRAFRLGLGGRVGNGRQWMSWIHLEDLLALIIRAIDDPTFQGAINAVAPHPVTNAAFTRALAASVHRPAILHAPAFVLRLMLGEMATLLLDGQRALPERADQLGFQFRYRRLPAALAEIVARKSDKGAQHDHPVGLRTAAR
ncbi:TIGR01777 family oxidoreductase [Dongia deserti]|uniref:TIGR01777 family oxidoreductase n=1 Tax=Dongia deserti TaxID=2268030 RepID=UPI000E64704C|nr:TIGR01777 family oxidoreductase [Dongia deserti]